MDLSWPDRLVNGMTIRDWIYIGALAVNIIALGFTGWSVRRQAKAVDLNAYFQFVEQFSVAWRRFRDAPEKNREFELTEIFGLFEAASHLYNNRRIHGVTREMVKDFLRDMLPDVFEDEYAKCVFRKTISSPKTYSEIQRFARENEIEGVPQRTAAPWRRINPADSPDY